MHWGFRDFSLCICSFYLLVPSFLWKAFPSPLVACCRINGSSQSARVLLCVQFTNVYLFIVVPCWCLCVCLGWLSPQWSLPLLSPAWKNAKWYSFLKKDDKVRSRKPSNTRPVQQALTSFTAFYSWNQMCASYYWVKDGSAGRTCRRMGSA